MLKKSGKTAALFVITLMVMGGFLGAALGQVQGTEKVTFSFVVLGNGQVPATGVKVDLESANGVVIASNISTPVVKFRDYPGNYVIFVPSQYSLGSVYSAYETSISVKANGSAYNSQGRFTEANVGYSPANSLVYVKVKGVSSVSSVYVTLPNGLSLQATQVNASNPSSGYSVTTVSGQQMVNVKYTSGSKAIYSISIDAVANTNNSIVANVSTSQSVFGTVTSTTGSSVGAVEVSIYQNGMLLSSDEFSVGYYYLSLPAGTYDLVVSSPGYLPKAISVTTISGGSSYRAIKLTPSEITQVQSVSFSSDFKTVTMEGGMTLTNASVLPFLPYSNAGSLYDQVSLNGLSKGQLWDLLNYSVPQTTVNTVLFDNYSYNTTGSTTTLTSGTSNGVLYQFNFTATYYQPKIKVQNEDYIQLHIQKDTNNGSAVSYVSKLSIPSSYQRANVISNNTANVTGYSGTITVTNSSINGFLPVRIGLKEKPTLSLDQISATWSGYFESTVSTNTSSGFTLLVPVGKAIDLNASGVPYDNVLKTDNYQNMNFTWTFDSSTVKHGYNISSSFASGSHSVTLAVTTSGGVTNTTNLTIIGDSLNPQFNLNVIQEGAVVKNVTTSSAGSYILWVNQTVTVYFNSIKSKDLLPSGTSTGLPISVNWNISGTKQTGTNVSYVFSKPTFGSSVNYANVSVKNGVGNGFNITFTVHVNDTTPPVASFQILNSTDKPISSAKEGQNITLNASKSLAPNGGTLKFYNWTFTYANGTAAKPNTDYKVYSHSSNNSTMTLAFIGYGTFTIKLKVTDQSGNSQSNSLSLVVNAVRPEVEIMNITYPKNYVEGSASVLQIVLKNVGLQNASTYYLTVKINKKVVKNETLNNLSSNQSLNTSLSFVPPSSGTYTMTVSVFAVHQPSFFNTNTSATKAISVSQAAWKLPVLVGGIVVAIGVLSFIYYNVTVRRKRPKEPKQQKKQLKI